MNQGDRIIIHNQPITTPGRIYEVLYSQQRTKTQHDPKECGPYVEWVYYENDMGVTDSVRAMQCEVVK